MTVRVEALAGAAFEAAIPALADLRIAVFAAYPYLYDGDRDYEARYLARFRAAGRAFLAAAFDGDRIVGAATAAPMAGEAEEFRAPLAGLGLDIGGLFYFAESLLLPPYRGLGLGHRFFDLREAHARRFGDYTRAGFYSVVRPADHPKKPAGYRPLDAFWRKRGYAPVTGAVARYGWKDIGEPAETDKPMQFWMRSL